MLAATVIQFLSPGEHILCRRVCRSLNVAARARSSWPERLCLRGEPAIDEPQENSDSESDKEDAETEPGKRKPRTYQEHLFCELVGRVTDLDVGEDAEWGTLASLLAPTLTALRCMQWPDDAYTDGKLSALTSLCLCDDEEARRPKEHYIVIACAPNLAQLHARMAFEDVAHLAGLPHLRALSLQLNLVGTEPKIPCDRLLQPVLLRCEKLRALGLFVDFDEQRIKSVTQLVRSSASVLCRLELLGGATTHTAGELKGCDELLDAVSKCPKLASLEMSDMGFSKQGLTSLANAPTLHTVWLQFFAFEPNLHHVKRLTVFGTQLLQLLLLLPLRVTVRVDAGWLGEWLLSGGAADPRTGAKIEHHPETIQLECGRVAAHYEDQARHAVRRLLAQLERVRVFASRDPKVPRTEDEKLLLKS